MSESTIDLIRYIDQAIGDLGRRLDDRYLSQQKAIAAALAAADKALVKQEREIERRFDAIDVRLHELERKTSARLLAKRLTVVKVKT